MKLHRIATALVLGGLLAATASQAALVSISPSDSSKVQGDTFSLDVNISGLGNELVSVVDLNIYFNPAVLKGLSISFGPGLGGPWTDLSEILGSSFDVFAYSNLYDPPNTLAEGDAALAEVQTDGSFTLMTLEFEAIGEGVSQVSFGNGANERDVVGRDAEFLRNQYSGACVAVNSPNGGTNTCDITVPEPATYGLVGMALLAAGFARRRAARQ